MAKSPSLPLEDLPPTEAIGERLAAGLNIVTRTASDDKEVTVLVAGDEHTGFIRAFSLIRKSTERIVRCLLQFLGKHSDHGPMVDS